jgi:hypothetical protein
MKIINPLTPELNPSAQRCLTRYFYWRFCFLNVHFVNICMKTNKYINYSFSLLITYGSSYIFWHYIAILRERSYCLLRDAQLRISPKAVGTLPEDGNLMPKHVEATIRN